MDCQYDSMWNKKLPPMGIGTDKNTGMNMGVIYNTYGY